LPDITLWFLLLFAGVTALMMALAVPLIRGRVKPNVLYGVRTPKTLGDERVWYAANAYGGRLLFGAGIVQLVAVVALYFVPRLHADFVAYNLACAAVILGGLLVVLVLLFRRIHSL
jgi:uncharacterized membrane protein